MFRKEPLAFVALPLRTTNSPLAGVIQSTLEEFGVKVMSAQSLPASSASFGIQQMLREADFVIADITGANANIMVEVGIALGMGKRLLLLSQSRSSGLPSDLVAMQVAVYQPEDVDSVRKYLMLWLRDVLADRESASS
jgi:hypothetical protein